MRLDALNWNIDWQQNTVRTCPMFSSATFHFTRQGCPGFKSIGEDCSCHLFPNLKMIAVALVSKRLPRSTYRNSKLLVENGKRWALTALEEQSRQPAGGRRLSDSQCKMGHSLRVALCQFARRSLKQAWKIEPWFIFLDLTLHWQRHCECSDYSGLQVYENGPQRVNPAMIHPNI